MSLDVLFFVSLSAMFAGLAFRSWRTFPKQHRKKYPGNFMVSGVIFSFTASTGFAQTAYYSTVLGIA